MERLGEMKCLNLLIVTMKLVLDPPLPLPVSKANKLGCVVGYN